MSLKNAELEAVEILRDELTFVVPPKHKLARRAIGSTFKEPRRRNFHRAQRRVPLPLARHPTTSRSTAFPCAATSKCPPSKASNASCKNGHGRGNRPRMCVRWEVERKQLAEVPHPPAQSAALFILGVAPRHRLTLRRRGFDETTERLTAKQNQTGTRFISC